MNPLKADAGRVPEWLVTTSTGANRFAPVVKNDLWIDTRQSVWVLFSGELCNRLHRHEGSATAYIK